MHWTLGPEVLVGLLGSILGRNTVIGLFFILSISGLCSCFGCLNFFGEFIQGYVLDLLIYRMSLC